MAKMFFSFLFVHQNRIAADRMNQIMNFIFLAGVAGQPITLVADTALAGRGELSCVVTYMGRNVPVRVETRGINIYGLIFTPQGGGEHKVSVFYSGFEIRGKYFYSNEAYQSAYNLLSITQYLCLTTLKVIRVTGDIYSQYML